MLKLKSKYNNYLEQLNDLTDDLGNHCCGYHYLVGINHDGKVCMIWPSNNIANLITKTQIKKYHKNLNYYLTLNTFDDLKNRTQSHVLGLCAIWIDIDCDNIGYPKSIIRPILPDLLSSAELPRPTAINDSGHGYHLIWLFSNEVVVHSKSMLKRWNMLEFTVNNRLNEAFTELAGKDGFTDSKVEDSSRILRVPNTLNIKHYPKINCKTIEYSGISYSMNWLCDEYIRKQDVFKYHGWNITRHKARKPSRSVHIKITHNVIGYINSKRATDLTRLIDLRNHEHNYIGYREELAFLYSVALVQGLYGSNNDKINTNYVYSCLIKLNSKFKIPLNDEQMAKLRREIPTMKKYIFSNRYYIDKLGITDDEAKSLYFLVSSHESKRRHNLSRNIKNRHRSHKSGAKFKRELRIKRVMELHNQRYSARQIAVILHLGNKTVSRYIKHS